MTWSTTWTACYALAQTSTTPAAEVIFGAGGWASFGIAGVILGWLLMKHLPENNKQAEAREAKLMLQVSALNESATKERNEQSAKHATERDQQLTRFEKLMERLIETNSRDNKELVQGLKEEFREVHGRLDEWHNMYRDMAQARKERDDERGSKSA